MGIQRRQFARRNGLKARKLPRRRKTGAVANLERRLTDLVRKLIWKRDASTCQKCFLSVHEGFGEVHHVIHKSEGKILRWEKENLVLLCSSCHEWTEAHYKAAEEWFAWRFPDRWARIEPRRHEVCKRREAELEAFIAEIEKELERSSDANTGD